MPAAKIFTKSDILRAMHHTKSVRSAARYLSCSYQHIKPYFKLFRLDDDDITSPTLFEVHKNQCGKGIPKFLPNRRKEPNVKNIVETGLGYESFTTEKLKSRIIAEGYLSEECYMCYFNERRVTDYKVPLLLKFNDGNKCNYKLENLELLCYNCYFLHIADPFTEDDIRNIESNEDVLAKPHTFDLDDEALANMKALGLL
jgi:hypothetical protein